MFPVFGFLVNFCIPLAGIMLAFVLLFIRRLRFLATYACFVPMLSGWCAFVGLLAVSAPVAIVLYKADPIRSHYVIFVAGMIFGLVAGGALGCIVGAALAFALNRAVPWLSQGVSKA